MDILKAAAEDAETNAAVSINDAGSVCFSRAAAGDAGSAMAECRPV